MSTFTEEKTALSPTVVEHASEGGEEADCRLHVQTKQHWGNIYIEPTPVPYYTTMTPYDYGHYHDRFLEMFTPILDKNFPDRANNLDVVEIGTSYGNTTLAYKCGLDWAGCGKVWSDDSITLVPTRTVNVTAVDMSSPALTYGLNRGIFDTIVVHDFNAYPPAALVQSLDNADVLVLIMISSYIKTLPLQRLCFNFLADRRKKKVIAYNDTCAFDSRNLSPEALFAGIKNWTTSTHFTKHRNFTESESALRHGCKESWSYTYIVTFDAIEVDNVNVH